MRKNHRRKVRFVSLSHNTTFVDFNGGWLTSDAGFCRWKTLKYRSKNDADCVVGPGEGRTSQAVRRDEFRRRAGCH